jgi:hypothetical protein
LLRKFLSKETPPWKGLESQKNEELRRRDLVFPFYVSVSTPTPP